MLFGTGALAGLLALGAGIAAAQDARPDGPPAGQRQVIQAGGLDVELLPDEPIQVCVLERAETAHGAAVLAFEAVLTPSGAYAEAPRWLRAVGPLADAGVEECFGLSGAALE